MCITCDFVSKWISLLSALVSFPGFLVSILYFVNKHDEVLIFQFCAKEALVHVFHYRALNGGVLCPFLVQSALLGWLGG